MKGVRSIIYLLIFFGITHKVMSQVALLEPAPISSNYMNNKLFVNPAAVRNDHVYNFNMNRFSYTGIRKVFRSDFFSFYYNNKTNQAFTFQINAQKKGEWINNTSVWAGYISKISLSKDLSLNGGVNIGFHQMGVAPNPTGISGNDIAPNARIGAQLLSEKFTLGLAVNDFIRNDLTIVDEANALPLVVHLDAEYVFELNQQFDLRVGGLAQLIEKKSVVMNTYILVQFQNNIEVGISAKNIDSFMGLIQYNNLELMNGNMSFYIGYEAVLRTIKASTSRYSLGLNFSFGEISKK